MKSLSSRWTSGLKMEYYLLLAVILLTLLVTKVQGKTTTKLMNAKHREERFSHEACTLEYIPYIASYMQSCK